MATRLFVGNLTFNSTENDLQDYFSQAGTVVSVDIMQDRTTGRSRGFAFVEMSSQADADKAIEMFNQKDFQGRSLTVNEAKPRKNGAAAVVGVAGAITEGGEAAAVVVVIEIDTSHRPAVENFTANLIAN